eukprot:gnl/TRDRNA2_/TRDRNA2_190926_c0_seq1.p1 gnl/TRDRNA2_/TRDRNA2_190926_c0~~gnl/TRDRNA2_/TRDRNA2_190926_c0_seq1.p1  ORF type:complete len:138 (+),score=20.96 gnl/TRDRNA2_/TRDRNA2_190926_c0_seq1:36-449(+)
MVDDVLDWNQRCEKTLKTDVSLVATLACPWAEERAKLQRRWDHRRLPPAPEPGRSGKVYPSRGSNSELYRMSTARAAAPPPLGLPHAEGKLAAQWRVPWRDLLTECRGPPGAFAGGPRAPCKAAWTPGGGSAAGVAR